MSMNTKSFYLTVFSTLAGAILLFANDIAEEEELNLYSYLIGPLTPGERAAYSTNKYLSDEDLLESPAGKNSSIDNALGYHHNHPYPVGKSSDEPTDDEDTKDDTDYNDLSEDDLNDEDSEEDSPPKKSQKNPSTANSFDDDTYDDE